MSCDEQCVSRDELASSAGAGMVGLDDGSDAQTLFSIMKATRRPAMDGIFSSGSNQLAALKAFVADSAANGQTIEWGPIDLSLDVVTPDGDVRGLGVPSNSRWVMHPDMRLRAIPTDSDSSTILNIRDKSNIHIEGCGAKLIGERDAHTDTGGQLGFGMGCSIRGSNNVTIRDLHAEDCWGDGWYIGSTSGQAWCENVWLENISSTRARRNGLSLISAKGFTCIGGRFVDTNGTLPQNGIDIEPNSPAEFLQNILLKNIYTADNASTAIGIFLNAMEGGVNPVDIRIIQHRNERGTVAFGPNRMVNIPGLIEYIDGKSTDTFNAAILSRGKGASGPRVKIVRPTIVDWNGIGTSSSVLSAGILIYAPTGDSGTYALGGIDIIEPDLRLVNYTAVSAIASVDQRTTTPDPVRDVEIVAPENLAGLPVTTQGIRKFTDPNRTSVVTLGNASFALGLSGGAAHYLTATLTTARTYTLTNTHTVGREMIFEIGGSDGNQARFAFPSGEILFPDQPANYIYSSTKGSRLKIRKAWNTLSYDAESAGFTVGATLTGGTSGATATIVRVSDAGTTGTLYLDNVVGTFQNDETITGSGGGSATANGTLGAEWFVVEKVGSWATA